MRSSDTDAARVVSAVLCGGAPLVLVEDTWVEDEDISVPESLRTWSSLEAGEVRTRSSLTAPGSPPTLAAQVIDELAGAAMERLLSAGVPREDMMVAVRRAQATAVREDRVCLTVDGEPVSGVSASCDGTTVRGVRVGVTAIVAVSAADGAPLALALGPPAALPTVG